MVKHQHDRDRLDRYRERLDFSRSTELRGDVGSTSGNPVFVIQKHDANNLHYDFRLAVGGVLKSWAVPKGPSTDPREKRLAIATEDHPLDYADFEGVITCRRIWRGDRADLGSWDLREHHRDGEWPTVDVGGAGKGARSGLAFR
ncbi:DNA polymerase ligase N-terminal domain-containing protein [Salinihabitans flavidus]|uniref:DNA polymerase ligase N-terminal domain-containing protein n=1 Tax=Salinihabitans flavidus TaxID=569882 RepID=UPI000AAE1180|nr:DNA polymerase ligase N-terminal domain-containing protein [Salinihabitans flavidus]